MSGKTFRLTSLGCAKNLVDSEGLAALLVRAGWRLVDDGPVDLVVVNTCSFVEDAAQESVDTLLAEVEQKRAGQTSRLAAVGCLPQKYGDELADAMPELDLVLGTGDLGSIVRRLEHLIDTNEREIAVGPPSAVYEEWPARLRSQPAHRAYLKIAEGCDNACAFCIIGRLRGPFRSRAPEAILAEAADLGAAGVVELNLVAQDLTLYGRDLASATTLAELLPRLSTAVDDTACRRLRLLYLHPARVEENLLRVIAETPRVVPYLDMPLQHVSDRVLQRMGRPQNAADSRRVVELARRLVPDVAIRTTFLLGHPGESEDDFAALLDFVAEYRFEHLGAFAWSPEKGTVSYEQDDWVEAELRAERVERLMELQQGVSHERLRERIGGVVELLVEEVLHKHDDEAYSHIGRLPQQAPEIDGVVYLRAPREEACRPGDIVRAVVTDAHDYDLFADLLA
ncbi:MAG: 30S ribosomal protein S12 methylthiotransferase RimO [Candidatus Lernaella stagnicola]|nr:30S ribosomal protein S12 methylthiotransferase RimO [Candidatus Lernaella stagnicola]